MPSKSPRKRLPRLLLKILLVFSGFLVLVLIMAALTVAFLPRIVSTDKARQLITDNLSQSLNHPVQIRGIDWTWTSGLKLSDINIPEEKNGTGKSLINISQAHLEIDVLNLFKGRLDFSFLIKNPAIHLVRDKKGRLNIVEAFAGSDDGEKKSKPESATPPEPEKPTEPFKLPLDIRTDIHLADIYISYQDHQAGQHYRIKNGDIRLKAPALVDQPVAASIDADIFVNDQKIPHAAINAKLHRLFDASRRMQLDQVAAQIDADLPGAAIHLKGDMAATGIQSKASVDLEALASAASPLLPELFKGSDMKGKIDFKAEAAQAHPDIIRFDAVLAGEDISLTGKILTGKRLGPGNMQVAAAGQIDLKKFDLKLDRSEIKLLKNSRLVCRGRMTDLKHASKGVDLTMAPVHIDLQEIAAFGKDYLPPQLVLGQASGDKQELSIEKIHLKGRIPAGQASVNIKAFNLCASDMGYQTNPASGKGVRVKDAGIKLPSVSATLNDLMPSSAEINAAIRIGHLAYEADKTSMTMREFALDSLHAAADQIRIEENSPFGVSGNYAFSNTMKMNSFEIKNLLALTGTRQSLDANLAVAPGGQAAGTIGRLSIEIPGLNLKNIGHEIPETRAGLDLSLADLRLNDMETLDLDIKGLALGVDVGRMLALDFTADAEQTGKKQFNAHISSDIDLARIMSGLKLQDRLHMDAAGNAKLTIQMAGRRPTPQELEHLKTFKVSENLDFLDHCRINLTLADGEMDYKIDETSRVAINGMSGTPLLSYALSGKNAAGKVSSQIKIHGISDLMGVQPEKPVAGEMTLDIGHRGLDRFNGTQRLQIEPGLIDQSIELALEGVAPALAAETPYGFFRQISGQAAVSVKIQESQALKELAVPGLNDIVISGAISSDVNIQKLPEDTLGANVRLNIQDFSTEMPDLFAFTGINGNIILSKVVKITPKPSMAKGDATGTWLSQQVMQGSGAYPMTGPSGSSAFSSDMSSTRPDYTGPGRGLSLQSGKIRADGLPIRIGPSRIAIGLSQGLPAIESIKLDVLGGTLLGDLLINQQADGYFLETRINFTGLDPASIFPEAASGIKGGASEISGALYANVPVARKMENLLENSEIRIEFRKIGSRALERLLYALDPYENNEAIVSQRRLLRMGSPKEIQISIKDGFLSLTGEILVKSVPISIPPLQRLNFAQLPGIKSYASGLSVMEPIIKALDMAAAEKLSAEKVFGK